MNQQTHHMTTQPRSDRRLLTAGLLVALVLVLAIATGISLTNQARLPGLITYPNLTAGVADGPITYEQEPPAGGLYAAEWQNCGIYNDPIDPALAVHSLARGAVWITYHPNLAISEIAALQRAVRDRSYILLSPNTKQAEPIMITAWGVQLPLNDAQDNRMTIFLARYRQNPNVPEAGQPCEGGVGEPIRPAGVHQRNSN